MGLVTGDLRYPIVFYGVIMVRVLLGNCMRSMGLSGDNLCVMSLVTSDILLDFVGFLVSIVGELDEVLGVSLETINAGMCWIRW